MFRALLFLFTLLFCFTCMAQEEIEDKSSILERDSSLEIVSLYKKDEKFEAKKKKLKKNEFYGFKTKRAFSRSGAGNKVVSELFYVLKKYQDPSPYVPEVYWFDVRKRKLRSGKLTEKDKPFAKIVHGPYKKYLGKELIEEGVFYIGTKHARWEKYDRGGVLLEKLKFVKGYPKESEVFFLDPNQTKVQEVKPIVNGEYEGKYLKFYPSGLLEMEGNYRYGSKVGIWTEYYDSKGQKKKELKYPDDPYDESEPILFREWDRKGKILYDAVKSTVKKDLQNR